MGLKVWGSNAFKGSCHTSPDPKPFPLIPIHGMIKPQIY